MVFGHRVQLGWLATFCLMAVGCGGPQQPAANQAAPAATPVGSDAQIELGDPIPMLDDGRIEAAPPKGWTVPSRDNRFVVRFQETTESLYPTIIVTAEDYPAIPDVTRQNVAEFAAKLQADESLKTAKPVQVGSLVGVMYRKRGVEKGSINKILERLFLATAVAGRKYSLELRTREGTLPETQPYLLAVARGIKFLKATPAEPAAEASQPAAESQPKPAAGDGKQEAKAAEKPKEEAAKDGQKDGKKDDLDLDNLNLDELLK